MKKWIRIKGVAAFLAIIATLTLFTLLFADVLIKKAIEKTGTHIVGARVELAEADLSLFPAGLTLIGLAVTNPDAPMTNAMEAERITLSVETLPLFFGKVIVPETSATGIRFATPRTHSGALPDGPTAPAPDPEKTTEPSTGKGITLPSLDINNPKEILARETLASVEEAKKIQADIKALKVKYAKRISELPDEEDFKAYEKRIKALKGGKFDWNALLTKGADLKEITDAVEKDLDAIKEVKRDLKKETKGLEKRIKGLPRLAKADYKRLKETYGPSAMGLDNITALLFGEAAKGKIETAIHWYKKIEPMLDKKRPEEAQAQEEKEATRAKRGEGINIAFTETRPRPDFHIVKGQLQLVIPAGDLTGTLEHITTQQPLVGRPMVLTLSGQDLKGVDAVALALTLDRVTPGTARDHLTLSGHGIAMKPMGSEGSILMDKAQAAFAGAAEISQGSTLDAGLKATLSQIHFAPPAGQGNMQAAINRALGEVKSVALEGSAKGPLEELDIEVASDLDTLLKKAMKNVTKELTAQFDKGLQAAINEKAGGSISAAGADLEGISAMVDDLAGKLTEGKGAL